MQWAWVVALGALATAEKRDRSQVAVNCPPGCVCSKISISCLNGNLSNTDIFLGISDTFFPDLDTLTISGNRFRELEASNLFGPHIKHHRLTNLNLSHNNIQKIHAEAFRAVGRVEELDLSDNLISDVKGDLLGSMPHLRKLSLHRAFSHAIEDRDRTHLLHKLFVESGNRLTKLEELDLSSNYLFYLPPDFLCRLPALRSLVLRDNMLRGFSAANASCLLVLETLDLSNNSISFLDSNFSRLMDTSVHLAALNLSLNPFKCDCYLGNFITWFQNSDVVVSGKETRCADASPAWLLPASLAELRASAVECADTGSSYLHSVYIVLALASVALLVLLAALLHGHRSLVCPTHSPLHNPASSFSLNKGYKQLGREEDTQPEFV